MRIGKETSPIKDEIISEIGAELCLRLRNKARAMISNNYDKFTTINLPKPQFDPYAAEKLVFVFHLIKAGIVNAISNFKCRKLCSLIKKLTQE